MKHFSLCLLFIVIFCRTFKTFPMNGDIETGEQHNRSTLNSEKSLSIKHTLFALLGTAGCFVVSTCAAVGSGMATTELFKHHPNIRASDNTDIPGYIIGANVFAAGICLGGICYCKIKDRYYN